MHGFHTFKCLLIFSQLSLFLTISGSRPQESKGSIVRVLLSDTLTPAKWGMKIKQISGKTMHLVVMPSAKALIGQYEVFVETKMTNAAGEKLVFRYKDDDTICVLFNAWCEGNRNTFADKYRLRWLGESDLKI